MSVPSKMAGGAGATEFFVFLPDEVKRFLAENGEDLPNLLRREGIDVGARLNIDPAARGEGSREVVLVLLGTAAVITALTPVLTRIVSAIAARPVIAKEMRLRPVESAASEVVRDKDGNPVVHWVEESRVVASPAVPEAKSQATSFEGLGLKFSYSSGG